MNKLQLNLCRTDLAYDEYERLSDKPKDLKNDSFQLDDCLVYKTEIGNESAKRLSKKPGLYYTLDLTSKEIHDSKTIEQLESALSKILLEILKENDLINKRAFVVGLGNQNITPDAIGPFVIDNTIVTRHLELNDALSEGFSNVCAMSPGVMGNTGIETFDVISSMVSKTKAEFVIVVDALATNSIKRINRTIQITDTGIIPGSGIGNKRQAISKETLGVPVIAIGIPTVIDASTITVDTIHLVLKHLKDNKMIEKEDAFFGGFETLDEEKQRMLVEEILTPSGYNLMVTPKEIDLEVEDLSKIIANAINLALHPGLFNGCVS